MIRKPLAALAGAAMMMGAAEAGTVTFGDANVDLLGLAGPQNEDGITYVAAGTGWEIQTTFGNPGGALVTFFDNEGALVGETVTFTMGLTPFTLDAFDFRSVNTISQTDEVLVAGFFGASLVGSLTLDQENTDWTTVLSPFAGPLTSLVLTVTDVGNNARIFDNFVLTGADAQVPLPLAAPLFGFGLLALRGAKRVARG